MVLEHQFKKRQARLEGVKLVIDEDISLEPVDEFDHQVVRFVQVQIRVEQLRRI
jgi:hypothetical protein